MQSYDFVTFSHLERYHLPAMCILCAARKTYLVFLVLVIIPSAFPMTASCTTCGNGIQRPSFLCVTKINHKNYVLHRISSRLHIVTALNVR